jgi:rhodanese-related sulfurtransferase
MRRTFLQMAALVVLGCAVGLAYNALSPKGIPVTGGTKARMEQAGARMVTLDEVKFYVQQAGTVVLDARSIYEYKLGHIPGALSLPADSFDPVYPKLQPQLKNATLIIVYCGGGSCGTSEEVAKKLIEKGFKDNRVAIFEGGLPGWMEANLPIQTGTSG